MIELTRRGILTPLARESQTPKTSAVGLSFAIGPKSRARSIAAKAWVIRFSIAGAKRTSASAARWPASSRLTSTGSVSPPILCLARTVTAGTSLPPATAPSAGSMRLAWLGTLSIVQRWLGSASVPTLSRL